MFTEILFESTVKGLAGMVGLSRKIVSTVHDVYDDSGNVAGEKLFDLQQESTETLRFLAYIQNIIEMISKGGVFIVDEMSARLHPLLTKLIVDIFSSRQNKYTDVEVVVETANGNARTILKLVNSFMDEEENNRKYSTYGKYTVAYPTICTAAIQRGTHTRTWSKEWLHPISEKETSLLAIGG